MSLTETRGRGRAVHAGAIAMAGARRRRYGQRRVGITASGSAQSGLTGYSSQSRGAVSMSYT